MDNYDLYFGKVEWNNKPVIDRVVDFFNSPVRWIFGGHSFKWLNAPDSTHPAFEREAQYSTPLRILGAFVTVIALPILLPFQLLAVLPTKLRQANREMKAKIDLSETQKAEAAKVNAAASGAINSNSTISLATPTGTGSNSNSNTTPTGTSKESEEATRLQEQKIKEEAERKAAQEREAEEKRKQEEETRRRAEEEQRIKDDQRRQEEARRTAIIDNARVTIQNEARGFLARKKRKNLETEFKLYEEWKTHHHVTRSHRFGIPTFDNDYEKRQQYEYAYKNWLTLTRKLDEMYPNEGNKQEFANALKEVYKTSGFKIDDPENQLRDLIEKQRARMIKKAEALQPMYRPYQQLLTQLISQGHITHEEIKKFPEIKHLQSDFFAPYVAPANQLLAFLKDYSKYNETGLEQQVINFRLLEEFFDQAKTGFEHYFAETARRKQEINLARPQYLQTHTSAQQQDLDRMLHTWEAERKVLKGITVPAASEQSQVAQFSSTYLGTALDAEILGKTVTLHELVSIAKKSGDHITHGINQRKPLEEIVNLMHTAIDNLTKDVRGRKGHEDSQRALKEFLEALPPQGDQFNASTHYALQMDGEIQSNLNAVKFDKLPAEYHEYEQKGSSELAWAFYKMNIIHSMLTLLTKIKVVAAKRA